MKRGLTVLACLCAVVGAQYFAVSKWGIRHESIDVDQMLTACRVIARTVAAWSCGVAD